MAQNLNQTSLLGQLQPNVLFSTLFKTDAAALCRLRRTCSFLDKFVEEHQERLAQRPHLGVKLHVNIRTNGELFISKDRSSSSNVLYDSRLHTPSDYKKRMSAVSVCSLTFRFIYLQDDPSVSLQKFVELQKEHKIRCFDIFMDTEWAETVVLIAKNIEYSREFKVTSSCRDPVEFCEQLNAADVTRLYWSIINHNINFSGEMFEKVKNFRCVRFPDLNFPLKLQTLQRFLWDLYESSGNFELEFIQLAVQLDMSQRDLDNGFIFYNSEFGMPSVKTLSRIRNFPRDSPRANFPEFVRLMEFHSQYAIILEFTFSNICTLFFVDKSCGTEFDAILYIVRKASSEVAENMERSYRDEYVRATKWRKQEIIRKIYLQLGFQAYALRMCDI